MVDIKQMVLDALKARSGRATIQELSAALPGVRFTRQMRALEKAGAVKFTRCEDSRYRWVLA